MDPMTIAFLTLAALLTGALLPLIFQARATLRSFQQALDTTAPRLDSITQELMVTTREFQSVAKDIGDTVDKARSTIQTVATVSSAVVPALMAGIQAFKAIRGRESTEAAEAAMTNEGPVAARVEHGFAEG